MNKDTGKLELAVGAFVLTGFAIIMFMILYISGGTFFSTDSYPVIVDIQNIGDLKVGAPVKQGGFEIGRVRAIRIAADNIQIVAAVDKARRLRLDTKASIATSGLVGDSFLELTRGQSSKFIPEVAEETDAPHVEGISQAGMGELLSQVQKIGSQVQELVGNINKVVGNEEFRKNIEQSVANVNSATLEARDLLANLRKDLGKVDAAVVNVVKISASAEETMQKVNFFVDKTIGDPKKVDEIVKTITSVQELTGTLSLQREHIATAIENISNVTGNLSRATAGIDPNRGLLRLLSDEQAGQDLLSTIQNIQRAANSLATVGLTDLIADKLAADRIFELWKEENKSLDAGQFSARWKEWMASQKRVNNLIEYGRVGALMNQQRTPYCAETPAGR